MVYFSTLRPTEPFLFKTLVCEDIFHPNLAPRWILAWFPWFKYTLRILMHPLGCIKPRLGTADKTFNFDFRLFWVTEWRHQTEVTKSTTFRLSRRATWWRWNTLKAFSQKVQGIAWNFLFCLIFLLWIYVRLKFK